MDQQANQTSSRPSSAKRIIRVAIGAVLVVAVAVYVASKCAPQEKLVVYCAHDSIYSEAVFKEFMRRSGIPLSVRFDTEATKSLGLTELLIREKDAPRCDVFWNNELLGTLDLQERGVLLPYKGTACERMPAAFKDPEGHWVGFGARMRVYIINTDKLKATAEEVGKRLQGDLARVAIAKPLYGTTLTHYSALWQLWGADKLQAWHEDWRKRGVKETTGNAAVKNLVANGVCDLGLTDTDDFFDAKDEGKPVASLPVTLDNGQVICIPNTASIIKGTKRLEAAKKLVDFLGSDACELALANSKSRQVPLGPVDEKKLTDEVRGLQKYVKDGYPLSQLTTARKECLAWLKEECLK